MIIQVWASSAFCSGFGRLVSWVPFHWGICVFNGIISIKWRSKMTGRRNGQFYTKMIPNGEVIARWLKLRSSNELCCFSLLNCNTQISTPTRGLRKSLLPSKTAYARVTFQEDSRSAYAIASAKVAATISLLDVMWSQFWFRRGIERIGRLRFFGWLVKGRRKPHQEWSTVSWCDRQSWRTHGNIRKVKR